MQKNRFSASTALYSVAFLSLMSAAPAFAQEAPAESDKATDQAQAPVVLPTDAKKGRKDPNATVDDGEVMVVTGSRLRRTEFNSPDPIFVINPELAQAQGQFSLGETVQGSSIASGSNQITSAISTISGVTNGGPGAETISLRGLGANRTLVLLNGRRAGPAGTRGGVTSFDLNVLPQVLVKSVEILKTGASSIYGSDAIAGVVNLLTKRKTDGLELNAQGTATEGGGGEQYRISGAWGKDFGNGHIMIAGEYFRRNELKRQDRDYLNCPEEYIFRADGSRADPVDPRTGSYRCADTLWGHNWVYTSSFAQAGRWQYSYGNDNLGAYIGNTNPPGFITPPGFFRVGYDRASASVDNAFHPFIANSTVIPETNRYTAYAEGDYDINEHIKIGTELLFNRRETRSLGYSQFYYLTGYTNNFDGTGFGDPFTPGWEGPYYSSPTPITDHAGASQRVDYYRAVGYAQGDFGNLIKGWDWNIWGQYSLSDGNYDSDVVFNDSINTFNYKTSSCVGTTVGGRPCLDINWLDPRFLRGDLNAAERAFLYGEDHGNTKYKQSIVEGSFSGPLFRLPAGTVQLAIGATWRADSINDVPGINQQADNNFVGSAAGITVGNTTTIEGFGEIEVPLIYNTPLIKSFTLSGSGRLTDFNADQPSTGRSSTSHGNWTYSIGANWEVTDWLRFRARYGTSFRAPALFELFLADQVSGARNRDVDPCVNYVANVAADRLPAYVGANCAAGTATLPGIPASAGYAGGGIQPTVTTGGGIGLLNPETSRAQSYSMVLTPKFGFLPDSRISLAVDYFNIRVAGEIAALSAAAIVNRCYRSVDFPNEPLCNLFTRNAPGTASQYNLRNIRASFININGQQNQGVDLTLNWVQDLGRLGTLNFLSQMTWQIKDTVQNFAAGSIESNNGEAGDPVWTGKFTFVYKPSKNLSLFYGLDVIGQTNDSQDYQGLVLNGSLCQTGSVIYGDYCVDLIAEKKFYHNISVTRDFKNFQITAGVSNLFNTRPPRTTITGINTLNAGTVPTLGQSVFTSQYDLLGRRFFINLLAKF